MSERFDGVHPAAEAVLAALRQIPIRDLPDELHDAVTRWRFLESPVTTPAMGCSTRAAILDLVEAEPGRLDAVALARRLGLTDRVIRWHLPRMVRRGQLEPRTTLTWSGLRSRWRARRSGLAAPPTSAEGMPSDVGGRGLSTSTTETPMARNIQEAGDRLAAILVRRVDDPDFYPDREFRIDAAEAVDDWQRWRSNLPAENATDPVAPKLPTR